MGVVYAARDRKLQRRVALKFLPPQWSHDESAKQRFIREAQAASATDHPNICTIHDIGVTDDGQLFIVMAHYEGETLKQRLERGAVPMDDSIDIAAQVAEGLAKAHAQGIVHRDIKPGNLMLTEDGVKILDFGLAKFADARLKLTLEGSTVGTVAYMSPEQVRGEEADARSDVWAVGVVLYEMLSGRAPFRGGYPEAIAHAIRNDPPAPLRMERPDIPESLEQIVFRAIHKDPSVRYQTARELARALRRLQGRTLPLDLRTAELSVPPGATSPAGVRRRAWRARVSIAAAVIVLAGLSAIVATQLPEGLLPFAGDEAALPENKNVAVLPFEVVAATSEDQAWAIGLSSTLSSGLAQLTGTALQVAPLDQAQAGPLDAARVRSDLGATLLLTGTIERTGTTVRVAARLQDTTTSREVRAADFTVAASDPSALLRRLLETALQLLEVTVPTSERDALVPRDTANPAAVDQYLQAQGYLQQEGGYLQYYERPENIESAIGAFSSALKLDPAYARAYAGLGEAYWRKYESTKEPEWADTALANCTRALVLDARLAAAHVCLGRVHDGRGRYEEAAVEFQRAIEIEPANDDAYAGLAHAQEGLGRIEEAENTYRGAIALRPQYWVSYNRLGRFYFNQARYGDAAETFAQVVALAPDSFRGYSNLGGQYIHLGRYDDAIAALERSIAIHPTAASTSNLGTAYFNRGRFAEAARAFERAVTLVDDNYELWGNLADAYYWAPGERPRAADAYRRALLLARPLLKVNRRNASLLVDLAHYAAILGDRRDALEWAARALEVAPTDRFVQFEAAVALNHLGETDRAVALIEKAAAAGYSVTVMRDTPDLSNLWSDPRFQNLIRGQ